MSFLIVNVLKTTHGGSQYIITGENYLKGEGQSNLIGHNVSAIEGTHTASYLALESLPNIGHLLQ